MRPKHRGVRIGASPRSVADAVADAVASSERSERVMSMARAATLLGCDRKSLAKWASAGMPADPESGVGEARNVDLKAVVEWRIEQARLEERKRYARPSAADETGPYGEPVSAADRLKEKQILQATQKMAILAKILVHREPLQMAIRQANGLARQSVMSIPEMLVRKLGSSLPKAKVQELYDEVWKLCAAALTSWATEVNAAMQAAAERVVEFDDDEE